MDNDLFLKKIQDRAQLADHDQARNLVASVLGTLAQRRLGGELQDTAAQLPPEIRSFLTPPADTEIFDAAELERRVRERLASSEEETAELIRIVLDTVEEAITDGQAQELRTQLPNDFGRFFS